MDTSIYSPPLTMKNGALETAIISLSATVMWKMKDVDLFVNITNDSWFGDTAAPHQQQRLGAGQPVAGQRGRYRRAQRLRQPGRVHRVL